MTPNQQVLIYQTQDGQTKLQVKLEDETVWLTIEQMAMLFGKAKSTINEHILNIFKEKNIKNHSPSNNHLNHSL